MPPIAPIVATLERKLANDDKALVGNIGYRRYFKTISDDHRSTSVTLLDIGDPPRLVHAVGLKAA
jgi:hypothetical protein